MLLCAFFCVVFSIKCSYLLCEHQFSFENGEKRAKIVPILVGIGATERSQWNIEFGMENNKTPYARTHSVRSKYTHTSWIGVAKTLNTFLLAIFTMHIEIDIRNYLLHNITLISFEYNFPILFVYLTGWLAACVLLFFFLLFFAFWPHRPPASTLGVARFSFTIA